MVASNEGLERVVGISGLAVAIINNTVGAGIFILPAIVSIQMEAAGILGYLFCSIMLATIMLCYAEVGSRVTTSGGSYAYVETAFGPFAGFIINWLFCLGWGVLGCASLMNIIADSLAVVFPVFSNPIIRAVLYLLLLGVILLINIRGAKQGINFVKYITLIKLLPLFGIIIFGFMHIQKSNLHWEHLPAIKMFGETTLVLFYAFAGFETSLGSSGEIKNPNRTIPLGILLGGISVFIIYVLIQTVSQGVLGADVINFKDAPLAAVAEKIIGPFGATILLVAAAFSSFANVSGDILATPRLLFAGANDGLFPKYLSRIHPKFATPYYALITYVTLIFIFSVSGGFKQLAILASCAILIIYLSVILSMIKLRFRKEVISKKGFRVPGGLTIPLIAIATIICLLISLSSNEITSTLIFIAVVSGIYFGMKKMKEVKLEI